MTKNIIVTTRAGLGDVLLITPALRAVKECYSDHKLIVYCLKKSHREVLLNNPYIDSLRLLPPLYLWRYPYHLFSYLFNNSRRQGHFFDTQKLKHYSMRPNAIPVSWLYNKNVKEVVPELFSDLDVRLENKNVQLFFTKREEAKARHRLAPYRNTIIMHVYSRTSVNHMWSIEKWEALVRELPEFTFIQVGMEDEPRVKGAIDWRDNKMGIRDIFCLLKYATSFVGVESCMGHATNAFGLPGVVLFGDTSPVHWGHDNNINIYKNVRCAPCFHHLNGDPCPYTHECMRLITVEDVKAALIRQVNVQQVMAKHVSVHQPADY
ncbi:hypothetical protein A4H97_22280 [Niastella yeongjuensis]|uniref:Heptosyltransferase n=1 Tax=Niastella yeongjuensis TaxID=354355 RepID=A0A1V9F796_9BACT|nr:glycosyltransferase family 9 protein [Niastella yeongjuensis]OQP54228.1 hypothetical protein A4H97_22280 [Niastella yeongjuensis]SEP31646.1 ADP-heptose:LPS heptosyltransferase [Niastella yeongjuensis]